MEVGPLLEGLEHAEGDLVAALAYLAAAHVEIDEGELRAARRRGMLLLATGGDPRRALDRGGRAVASVAVDLDTPERRRSLLDALASMRAEADALPRVRAAIASLLADEEEAWRWLACALLADELVDGGDE